MKLHPLTCMACLGYPGMRIEPCGFCAGIDDRFEPCQECQGYGSWEEPQPFWDDPYHAKTVTCRDCGGSGWVQI